MTGNYERTFSVAVPIERAWRACTEPDELAQWFFAPLGVEDGEAHFDLFGTEVAWQTEPGTSTGASWVRDGSLHRGHAILGRRPVPEVSRR